MSSKQATSPFASVVDGDDAMSQEHLSWEKEESAEAHGTPQLPLHSLLHGKAHPDEMQPLSSVPPESDWDSLVSAQQRMVRNVNTVHTPLESNHRVHFYWSRGNYAEYNICKRKNLLVIYCESFCSLNIHLLEKSNVTLV